MSSSSFQTLADLVRDRAAHHGNRIGYRFTPDSGIGEQTLTYAELECRARAIAVVIRRHNRDASPVPLLFDPGLDYIAAFFACAYAGAPAVPLYPPRGARTFARFLSVLTHCGAAVVLTNGAAVSRVRQLLPADQWIVIDIDAITKTTVDVEVEASPDAIALIQYTSGSTSEPRGVALTHTNILANSAVIYERFGHSESMTGVSWLPPYHDMGLIGGIVQPLYAAFPAFLMSPTAFLHRPASWLELLTRAQAATSGGPNFAYELCVERIQPHQMHGFDLSHWEVAFCGAEPIRASTLRRFAETFARCGFRASAFYPCYGLAEATLMVSGGTKGSGIAVRPRDDRPPIVSCGTPIAGHDVVIVDPEERTARPDGAIGEIWVRGASVACGYWRQPDASASTFTEGGFLRTGDLGFLHQGELFIAGRLKELIIIGGRNFHPHDIEEAIASAVPVLAAGGGAAFSLDRDDDTDERLVVIQEPTWPGRHEAASAMADVRRQARRVVSETFGIALHDLLLIRPGTLPRTSSGKPKRLEARALYISGQLTRLVATS